MLTGDNHGVAEQRHVSLASMMCRAELMPEDKVKAISRPVGNTANWRWSETVLTTRPRWRRRRLESRWAVLALRSL